MKTEKKSDTGKVKKFYRYELEHIDEGGTVRLFLRILYLKKETAKGYWIKSTYVPSKFILKADTDRKFARETKKRALECYIRRTKIRVRILRGQINACETCIEEAYELIEEELTKKQS